MQTRRPGWRGTGGRATGPILPTEEEVLALADAAPSEEFRAYVLVAAYSGLRLFEVAALDGACVHLLPDGACRVEVLSGKGGYYGESSLFEPGKTALLHQLPEIFGQRVFSTASGQRWDRKSVGKVWVRLRRPLGLDHVTFHTLRHFHATWLLDMGVPVLDVAAQLRHRDNGQLVQRVYGHPNARRALDRIEERVAEWQA